MEHVLEPCAQPDPVVGDAVLRVVVGADLLGAFALPDLGLSNRRLLGREPAALELVEARAQHAHRLVAVLQLRALVLHRDHDPGRQVGDPDGGVGRVDRLATGPRGAEDVDLQVLLLDRDVDVLRLGHHRDRRRRGVDAPLRLGVGDALDAVGAALVLVDRVGALALDRVDALLEAAAVARAHLDRLPAEAAPLSVALEHPREVARPERRLVAADAGANLDDHVLVVGGIPLEQREPQLALEPLDLGGVVGAELGELGLAAGGFEVGARLAPGLGEPVGALELLEAPADLLGGAMVAVERRVGLPFEGLAVGAFELLDECVKSRHWPSPG